MLQRIRNLFINSLVLIILIASISVSYDLGKSVGQKEVYYTQECQCAAYLYEDLGLQDFLTPLQKLIIIGRLKKRCPELGKALMRKGNFI